MNQIYIFLFFLTLSNIYEYKSDQKSLIAELFGWAWSFDLVIISFCQILLLTAYFSIDYHSQWFEIRAIDPLLLF